MQRIMEPKFHDGKLYRELRCEHCRHLIAYEYIISGRLLFECRFCKNVNVFNFVDLRKNNKNLDIKEGGEKLNG